MKTENITGNEILVNATTGPVEGNAWGEGSSSPNADPVNQADFTPSDPLFSSQWHLNGTFGINIADVWNEYTGRGVRVAVYDQGIDPNHPDLTHFDAAQSINASTSAVGGVPLLSTDNHGTAVAGIIGATANNGIGGVGVAYDSILIGIYDHFGADGSGTQGLVNGYNYITGHADVENNSWGYGGVMGDDFRSASFAPVATALTGAATNGRNGLGCVIVQSAGNARPDNDNVNYHNFQNSRFITTVAATLADGSVASYSTPGASILVAAPGSDYAGTIVTTDRRGTPGYTTGDYTTTFNGTSAAAPMVSGVVALMLEANPRLGLRDVQEILALSARSTPNTASSFQFNGSTHWNGGGMHFSDDVGAGLVDARAAVRLAETWQGQHTVSNEASILQTATPNLAIPDADAAGATSSIEVGSGINIDHVEVDLQITHPYIGDLVVTITSPTGTVSRLFNRAGGTQNNINFVTSSTQFWGETGTGNWTLKVQDMAGGDIGTLNSWSLRLYGDSLSADDVYGYTNEFGTTSNNLTARQALNDTNGGTDSVNAAAVTSNSVINLSGGVSTIAGRAFSITANKIEKAYGGDGNDTIIGNMLTNQLYGGRGNDFIDGGVGDDAACYFASSSNYTVIDYAGYRWVGDNRYIEGLDRLTSIEQLNFSDRVVGGSYSNFDGLQYIASYGDLIGAFGTNQAAGTAHYVLSGYSEHRATSFDGLEYIASYRDLISAFGANQTAGTAHYIQNGYNEHRSTSFDGLEYIASYGDLISAFGANQTAGATHYIQNGYNEHRSTSFDGLEYIASYGDLISAFGANQTAGATHYIQNGYNEHRSTTRFDAAQYLANYGDLRAAFGADQVAATNHYINYGYREGRTYSSGQQGQNAPSDSDQSLVNSVNEQYAVGNATATGNVNNSLDTATLADWNLGVGDSQMNSFTYNNGAEFWSGPTNQ